MGQISTRGENRGRSRESDFPVGILARQSALPKRLINRKVLEEEWKPSMFLTVARGSLLASRRSTTIKPFTIKLIRHGAGETFWSLAWHNACLIRCEFSTRVWLWVPVRAKGVV